MKAVQARVATQEKFLLKGFIRKKQDMAAPGYTPFTIHA